MKKTGIFLLLTALSLTGMADEGMWFLMHLKRLNEADMQKKGLKLTAEDMLGNGLIDGIIEEPMGGAHQDPATAAAAVKAKILADLAELERKDSEVLVSERIEKFSRMGTFVE